MHECWELILEMETTGTVLKGEHIPLMHLLWLNPHTPSSPFSLQLSNISLGTGEDRDAPKVPISASWELDSGNKETQISTSHQICHLWLCILQGSCQHLQQNICQENQQGKWERTAYQKREMGLLMSVTDKIVFVTKYPVYAVFWEKFCCFPAISWFVGWNPSWAVSVYCQDIEVEEAKSAFISHLCLSRKLYGSLPFKYNSCLVPRI